MSETSPANPAPKATKPAVPRGKKWRKRIIIALLIVVGLAIIARALVSVLLPPVLRKVAGEFGLTATYDKLDLYALSGDIGLWNLRFTPLTGGEPVVSTSYCRGSIDTLALLRGKLKVNRAEAEDAEVLIERRADGTIPMLQPFLSQPTAPPAAQPQAASGKPTAMSLEPPLTIDVLRLQHGRCHIRDLSLTPNTDVSLLLDLLVTNVGSQTDKARVDLQLHSPEALVALYVSLTGMTKNNQLDADLSVKMYGLNLMPATAYLEPFGIVPVSNNLAAQMEGHLQARVNPTTAPANGSEALPSDLSANLVFDRMQLSRDGISVASVKSVKIDIPSLAPGAIRVASIDIDGVRANAARTQKGRLAFSGIELVPASPTTAPVAAKPKPAPAAAASALPASAPMIFELKALTISDVGLSFDDASLPQPVKLALNASAIKLQHVSTDPAQANDPATLTIEASAPGLAKTITLNGTATPAQDVKKADLKLAITGISPTAAEPYLTAMGLENSLVDGNVNCTVSTQMETNPDGSLSAGLKVKDIRFADGKRELFTMPGITVDGATVNADASRIKVSSIAIEGPAVPIQRGEDGTLSIFGIRAVKKPAAPAAAAEPPTTKPVVVAAVTTAPATQPAPLPTMPAIEIGKFTWHGASLVLNDLQTADPLKLGVQDITVDIDHLGLDPNAKSAAPGTVRIAMRAPGVIDRFNLDGTLTPSAGSIGFDFKGHSTGISAKELKPVLTALGLECVLHDGSLEFSASGTAKLAAERMSADVTVGKVSLTDGGTAWLALQSLQIKNATFDGHVAAVDAVQIDQPAATVLRDREGLISVAGIKLLAPKPAAPTTQPAAITPAAAAPTAVDLTLPIIARLKSFKLNKAELKLQDDAVLPPASVSAVVSVSAEQLAVGEDAAPSPFSVAVTSAGVIDSLQVDGHFKLAPHLQQVDLVATGKGIYGQALEPYLPPNAKVDFNNGDFAAKLSASVTPNPAGGLAAKLAISDVRLNDGIAAAPIAGVESVRVNVERIDLPGRRIAIDEIAVEGIQAAVTQDEQGLSLMGLTLTPKPLRPAPPPPKVAAEPIALAEGKATDVATLVQEAKEKPPLVTLKKLSIQADRLSFASPTMAAPLAIVGLSVTNAAPIELLGDDPTQRAPFDLQLKAGVEQLVDSVGLNAHLAPLATEPLAKVDLDVTGIHATGLSAILPSLKDVLDGQNLSNGRFTSSADARFKFTRRGPAGIDLTRDISTDVVITNTRLTQNGVERPLAGVDEIRCESAKYSPVNGSFIVKSIDIEKPMAHVERDAAGIHLLGLTLKTAPPATQPTTAPATLSAEAAGLATAPTEAARPATLPAEAAIPTTALTTAVADASATTQPAAKPAPEYRIDRFRISGVDFVIEDRLGDEPTILPINALDVDVKGLSSAALVEPKPIRFSAILGAGKVPLPPRDSVAGGKTLEERPVFSEVSASGNFVLVPKPKGYIKFSLSGLEMSAIRGLASQAKIKVDRGSFDVRTDVRMEGTDKFDARVYPTFNELRISEPPDGPVQRILKLSAPLDVIVATLEDSDGSLSLPLTVPLEAGKVDTDAIIGSAAESAGRAIGNAMLASGLKAANLVGTLLGADTTSSRSKGIEPVVITFAPGESQLTPAQRKAIDGVLDQMRKDDSLEVTIQHTLSPADVTLAEQRSNPLSSTTLALTARLRQRKDVLERQMAERSSQLRVALASQNQPAAEQSLAALRATSIELKEVDDGLEQVLSLLAPGAAKQTERRTKSAAILLGDLRLRAVQQAFLQSDVKSISDHVRKANALFNPESNDQPGRVTLLLVRRAKQ